MDNIVFLIPFIPLIIAILLLFVDSKKVIPRISIFFSGIIMLLSIYGTYRELVLDKPIISDGKLLIFDRLSSVLTLYVAIVGIVIRKYASKYMWDEAGYKRFFVLLNFIFSSIYFLLMSNNLLLIVLSWIGLSLSLFYLISFRADARASYFGILAFWIHKIGDIFFVLGIALLFKESHVMYLSDLNNIWLSQNMHVNLDLPATLIILGAMCKSALIPFHIWLPYTSEGPTPVSALMHAGIVNVGGIILNRFAFMFLHTHYALNFAFLMGLATAVIGSLIMLSIPDIKRALGYSTVGQMGYMIMEAGVGAFSLAIYHLMVHGIFKATLFLESGNVINQARKEPNITKSFSYKVFVEEEEKVSNKAALTIGVISIALVLYTLVEFVMEKSSANYYGALLFLAFGWFTSFQLFNTFFKTSKTQSLGTVISLITSFVLIVIIYSFVGLGFEHYLYGKNYVRLFKTAHLSFGVISISIAILTIVAIYMWILSFVKESSISSKLYRLLYEEFFIRKLILKSFKLRKEV